jgi:hypothetical protein
MDNMEIMKDGARRLETYLKETGCTLSHGQALNALSVALGERNWKSLRAALGSAVTTQPEPYYEFFNDLPNIEDVSFTLFIEAHACDDYGDAPNWLMVTVNKDWLEHLATMTRTAKEHNLSNAEEWDSPYWQNYDEFRFTAETLNVSQEGGLYWQGYPKHCNYAVETRYLTVPELGKLLSEAIRNDQTVMYHGMEPLDKDELEAALESFNG